MDDESSKALERFVTAQEVAYSTALNELTKGKKRSHWMWFIFPQIAGLGYSSTAIFFSIKHKQEAIDYLNHPILGKRLIEITEAVVKHKGFSVKQIFGDPDYLKFRSSMTLFASCSENGSIFHQAIDIFYQSEMDEKTLGILGN
ncbi:MAG: DUF1810 domain-containing protein [Gammaproteobacteria bacterium]|nr:DUF1810 domain-containing protein [Gammaproteobacteria bacterium]